jgi:ribose transport system permease protein
MSTAEDAVEAAAVGAPGEKATPEPGPPQDPTGQSNALLYVERFALPAAFIIMLIFFSVWGKTGPVFRRGTNFQEVAGSQAYLGILVLASIIPLVCGEFDFSVGQVAGFTQIATASAMSRFHLNLGTSVLIGIAFGAFIGLNNGNAVARIGVNSLIVTLGTSGVLLGLVNWYTHGQSIGRGISTTLTNFGSNNWLGVPEVFYLLAVVALLVYYVLEHTPYGRYLTSIGSNEQAARLVGLNVRRLKLSAFVLSGALAGLAGVLLVARNGAGNPGAGTVIDTLTALAAVFLGATAIKPGRFNVLGSMIAIYFIAFTVTGLQLAGVQSWINNVFNGAALFVAVVVSTAIGRRRTGVT